MNSLALTVASALIFTRLASGGEHATHVILISCDGLRPDAVEFLGKEGAPNFHRLIDEGAHTHNARTDTDFTVTLPNHTAMITGRGVSGESGHNWTENGTPKLGMHLHKNKKTYLESMFDVAHDHGLPTALFASKVKFRLFDLSYNERWAKADTIGPDNGRDKINTYVFTEETEDLTAQFLEAIGEDPFQLSMLHLRDTDTAGHAEGWDIRKGSRYLSALTKLDGLIGKVLAAVAENPTLNGTTCVIVTTDHGGRLETKTHTDATQKNNFTIPFYVWGNNVAAGEELYEINTTSRQPPTEANPDYSSIEAPPIRNGDAGNLALSLLGLPAIKGSMINASQDLKVSRAEEPETADRNTRPATQGSGENF